jgi:hypothetical protein
MADQPKASGGALQRLVLWFVIALLLAAVWFLASERNQRHFRVATENGQLVIERGRFFPTGTGVATDKIYAALPVPAGEKAPAEMEFDDQTAADRYLFGVFGDWARNAAKKGDTHAAAGLVDRAAELPGLSGSQVTELTALKADLAWDESQGDLAGAAKLLDDARRKLEMVKQNNGMHATDAAALQPKLQSIAADLAAAAKH